MAEGEEEVMEEPWVPSNEDISNALSGLAKTEDGASVVYTKLALPGKQGRRLASLQFPMTLLENVRHLDISNNIFITDINEAVGQMERLLSLRTKQTELESIRRKATGNRITAFEPAGPMGLCFLQSIDLSKNKLTAWTGLESRHLRYLDLRNNELRSVRGLEQNPELQTLLLSNNRPLATCAGLGLASLKELSLTSCGLESLEGLASLTLPALDLTDNAIKNVAGLSRGGVLKKLVLAGNPIESLDALDDLVGVGLTDLTLPDLPDVPDVRIQVIQKLSPLKDASGAAVVTLAYLNGAAVTPAEIEQAFPPPAQEPPAA